jgi:hypothetical protein
MKKVLAFVLVLAMVLGSVSMAFAATTDYADDAAITNKEAVGVLSGLKVLEGDANGFRPADTLTRAEAAAIVARLLLGREDADKLTASAALFSDVPANHWAAGYIAYCVSQGIIAGNGDGTFTPDGVLTVPAFGKMLLCALGYDAQVEGLVGSNWEANTASLMVKANIAVSAVGACTRDTAALMGLKTLEADIVEYASKGVSVNTGSAQVVVGGSAASKPAYTNTYKYNNVADGIEQLAERVYKGKLIKTPSTTDKFGRPGNQWTYTGSIAGSYVGDIGTFGKENVKVFTGKMTEAQVNTELNGYKMDSDAGLVNIDKTKTYTFANFGTTAAAMEINDVTGANPSDFGTEIVTTAALTLARHIAEMTEDGRVMEFYADGGVITNIVIFDYTVAKVTSVTTGSKRTSYSLSTGDSGYVYTDGTKDSDTVVLAGEVAKNDYVTYIKNGTKFYIYPTTKTTGEQTSYTNGSSHFTIVLDGTTYTVGKGVVGYSAGAFATNNSDVTVYFDQNGFAVYSSSAENTEYAFILEAYAKDGKDNYGKTSYTPNVKVLLADGTVADYTIATKTVSKETVFKTLTDVHLTTNGGADAYATGAAVVGALAGKVVTYSISDGKLDIKGILGEDGGAVALNVSGVAINSYSTTKFASKIVTAGSNPVTGEIKSGTTKYESATPITSLTNSDSSFVVYNTDKKTAATYTSVPKIAAGKVASANDFVVVYKQDTINNVVVAFVKTNGSVQGSSSNYAYIKGNAAVTQTKSGDDVIYSVTGYDANGEEITITRTNDDFTGFLATTVAIDANNVFVDGYLADGGLIATSTSAIVSGNILQIGTTYYNITDKTATVLVDSDATKVNGNKVVIVLDDKSTDKLDILTIFVYGSNE